MKNLRRTALTLTSVTALTLAGTTGVAMAEETETPTPSAELSSKIQVDDSPLAGSSNIFSKIGNELDKGDDISGEEMLGSTQAENQPAWATAMKATAIAAGVFAVAGIANAVGQFIAPQLAALF